MRARKKICGPRGEVHAKLERPAAFFVAIGNILLPEAGPAGAAT